MKRRLCPQCKIPNFYVLNEKKELFLQFLSKRIQFSSSFTWLSPNFQEKCSFCWRCCNRVG